MLHGFLVRASIGYRIQGKRSVVPYISGCVEIAPDEIPLGTTEYDIDTRSVVVQRQRIIRSRARVFPWRATFGVRYDDQVFSRDFMVSTFREMVENGGRGVGIMDFRPEKRGRFGRFHVEEWSVA